MRSVASSLLSNNAFFIEFQGYLSNHAKHAIVALERLNAKESRVQYYWDEYTTLTPYGLTLKPSKPWKDIALEPSVHNKEWFRSLRGKKEQWQEMCMYLEEERINRFGGSADKLVQEYAPDLLGGIAGALTHGIIHLGWGIDASNDWMTVEGLAYLNFCYLGVDESKLTVSGDDATAGPMKALENVAREFHIQSLAENWVDKTKKTYNDKKNFHPELVVAGFQWELSKLLEAPHEVATTVPAILSQGSLDDLWKQWYHTVTWIYLATRDEKGVGNFLVLHLVTSLWGLEHVCRVINKEEVTRQALQEFYASAVCLLAASAGGFPTENTLQSIQTTFPLNSRDDASEFDWTPVVERGIQETEEHNIKLVYVMRELWNRYDRWQGFSTAADSFTTTPNIGPASKSYKA
eukprot:CAMPEP_0197434302 /NCGR_PEP_ID=MMETSP1175-20131217/2060_1 /TAXON_ID=1003142 /ORGANISM="Triceratium dubium, Strain CCMP147" /LENGTH=405 /DNA_ID=CAMNT_0042962979 /DNA_START=101 /DNA_END=1318 /DNA_ORIENTATION=+